MGANRPNQEGLASMPWGGLGPYHLASQPFVRPDARLQEPHTNTADSNHPEPRDTLGTELQTEAGVASAAGAAGQAPLTSCCE